MQSVYGISQSITISDETSVTTANNMSIDTRYTNLIHVRSPKLHYR
mgnify:FL=1